MRAKGRHRKSDHRILSSIRKYKPLIVLMSTVVVFVATYALILPAMTLDQEEAAAQGGIDVPAADQADVQKNEVSASGTLTSSSKDFTVSVDYDKGSGLSQDTTLSAKEILDVKGHKKEFKEYQDKAKAALQEKTGKTLDLEMARFFDITLGDKDGEVEPRGNVDVFVDFDEKKAVSGDGDFYIIHFTENEKTGKLEAAVLDDEDSGFDVSKNKLNSAKFTADSFSVYGIVYTVDFHYDVNGKNFDYSIPGGSAITLSEIVKSLEITDGDVQEFVDGVDKVEFSDPSLVWVGKADKDTTVGALKDENKLDVENSSELTKEQIEQIDAQKVRAGDWVLISLKSFEAEKTLTVTMKNGDAFDILVTDHQVSANVLTADGKNYKITVTYDDDAEIPEGTKLVAEEIEQGSDEYLQHLGEAWKEVNKEYLEVEEQRKNYNESMGFLPEVHMQNLDEARFFDVKMMYEGEEVEPNAPVHVEISYVDGLQTVDKSDVSIAHFSQKGLEIIDDVEVKKEDSEVVCFNYEQDSFSDIGTLITHETHDLNKSSSANRFMRSVEQQMAKAGEGGDGSELAKPYANKTLKPNKNADGTKDGTYTLTLSVGGTSKETSYSDVSKSNVLIVMDRSSSMQNNNTYDKYTEAYNSDLSYYGVLNGAISDDNHIDLTYRDGSYWYYRSTGIWGGEWREYNGNVYTRRTRLEAEQDALNSLVSELTAKNKPGETITDEDGNAVSLDDIIEVKIISFASGRTDQDKANGFKRNGRTVDTKGTTFDNTESDWGTTYTSGSSLQNAVTDKSVAKGTNWQEAMQYAKEEADKKKAAQPDEPVYVIFLTDGEPTDIAGDNGNAQYSNGRDENVYCLQAAEPDAKAIVDTHNIQTENGKTVETDHKFYGIFTYGNTQEMKSYLERLVNYAYGKGDNSGTNVAGGTADYYYDADSTSALLNAFQNIFSQITNTMAYGKVSIKDGLTTDAMTTTLVHGKTEGYKYTVEGPVGELYSVTATSPEEGQTDPQVIFTINGHNYPGEKKTTTIDGTEYTYWSYTSGSGESAIEYKMTLADVSENGELTWDLTGIGTLMDGYTYNVSFVVWPDQKAYDYVAGLNNGLKGYTWDTSASTYQDLSETKGYEKGGVKEFPSIVKYKNGTFAVLTNTEQKLQYSIVETKEEDGTTTTTYDGPYEFDLPTPKPMDLTATASMISKVWNIERDPKVLAQMLYDPDGTSKEYNIGFEILQKEGATDKHYTDVTLGWDAKKQKYVWDETTKRTVDYNGHDCEIATRWDADFSIATGLMISEARRNALGLSKTAYPTAEYNGETYYILEAGHDYTIKEPGISYEFDFSAPVYHPMLVDGVLQNVFLSKEGDTYKVSKMEQISVKDGVSSLVIANTLRGYIHLNKIVVDKTGKQLKDDDTKFTYTIKLNNELPVFKDDSITWYGINELFYHDENFNYYQAEPASEAGKLSLKDEAGNTYTATCDGKFNPDIIGPTKVMYTDKNGNQKTIQLYGNQMTPSDGSETEGYKSTSAELKINQTETVNIANVPVNTTYTITEAQEDGYDLDGVTRQVGSGTVENLNDLTVNGTIAANTDNNITYKNKLDSVNITVQKLDDNGDGLEGAVFQLKKVGKDGKEETLASTIQGIRGIGTVTKNVDGETKTYESSFETTGEVQTIKHLPDGTYRLYEVYVPAGYISTYQYIQFKIEDRVMKNVTTDTGESTLLDFTPASETGTEAKLALLKITNEAGAALPSTGGIGTTLLYMIGALLVITACGGLVLRRRRIS